MDERLKAAAEAAKGFMPADEGIALYEAARGCSGPFCEIGSYCGKSAIYLGAAAAEAGTVLYSIDHHRGSEELQAGWEHHDPDLVDVSGRMDSLPTFRRTIESAELDDDVVAVVGESATLARWWATPLGFLFIDGGHSEDVVAADTNGWAPHVRSGGLLAMHDVFENPSAGGQGPFRAYEQLVSSGGFEERARTGSLRVLVRG